MKHSVTRIVIIGGKGNGTVVLSCLLDMNKNFKYNYEILGFVNDNYDEVKSIDGYPVLGKFDDFMQICVEREAGYINAITSTKTIQIIREKFEKFKSFKSFSLNIIHPTAFIAYNVKFLNGIFVGPQNYIGQNCEIGDFVFIHSQNYIARDVKIRDYSYFAPKVYIGAEAEIKSQVYVGINGIIRERVKINKNSVIGMGSLIIEDIEEGAIYYGQKAKKRN